MELNDLVFQMIVLMLGLLCAMVAWISNRQIQRLDKLIVVMQESTLSWSEKHHGHDKRISSIESIKERSASGS